MNEEVAAPLRQDEPSISDVNEILSPPEPEEEQPEVAAEGHEENLNQEPSGEDEGQYVNTITELAESLEADPTELYGLNVPMSDDMDPVSISALKDFYVQHQRDSESFKAEKEAFEAEKQKTQQFFEQQNQAYLQTNQQMQQVSPELQASAEEIRNLQSQYNMVDWDRAEEDDPGEAALMRQKFSSAMEQANGRYNQAFAQVQQVQQQQFENFKMQQAGQVMKQIPEWRDPKIRNSEWSELSNLITSYGFTTQDLEQVYDARIIKVMSDYARLKRQFDAASPETRALNKATGKNLARGKLRLRPSKKDAVKKIIEKGAATENQREKAAAVSAILNM